MKTDEQKLNIVGAAAQLLLENGSETYRVEETAQRMAKGFGMEQVNIAAFPTSVFLEADGRAYVRRISRRGTNSRRIAMVNEISREVEHGKLSAEQAERALAFCNNSGPAFLVGAAGVGVFHSAGYGLLLYGVHVLSAIIVGMLFAPRSGGFPPEERAQIAAVSLSQALPEAVRSAVRAVLTVSGFVVTFSVVTGVLDASGLLPALVGTLAARLGLELHFARALCTGVLELGTGIGAMQGLAPTPANLALAAFLTGWGGVSVHCQTAAVIAGTDIKSARHTVGRLLHGTVSALCMWVLANLL